MITINKHSDIPGWGNFHRCYAQLIACLPTNAAILEVGAGFGRGTWTFLDVLTPQMTLRVVDSFKLSSWHLWVQATQNGSELTLDQLAIDQFAAMTATHSQKDLFFQSVSQHPNRSQLEKVYAITSDFYMAFKRPAVFDLVFLDGAHDYATVSKELNYFKQSTLLAGHDYANQDCADVKQAVDDFLLNNPNKRFTYYHDEDIFVIHEQEFELCKTSEPLVDSR